MRPRRRGRARLLGGTARGAVAHVVAPPRADQNPGGGKGRGPQGNGRGRDIRRGGRFTRSGRRAKGESRLRRGEPGGSGGLERAGGWGHARGTPRTDRPSVAGEREGGHRAPGGGAPSGAEGDSLVQGVGQRASPACGGASRGARGVWSARVGGGMRAGPPARIVRGALLRRGKGSGGRKAPRKEMERETGFEPATSTLARSHSTTELFPLGTAPARAGGGEKYQCPPGPSRPGPRKTGARGSGLGARKRQDSEGQRSRGNDRETGSSLLLPFSLCSSALMFPRTMIHSRSEPRTPRPRAPVSTLRYGAGRRSPRSRPRRRHPPGAGPRPAGCRS